MKNMMSNGTSAFNSAFALGRGKLRKGLELAGRKIWLHTDFWPAVRLSNMRTLREVSTCAVASLGTCRELYCTG
jgi:hypothetical protein